MTSMNNISESDMNKRESEEKKEENSKKKKEPKKPNKNKTENAEEKEIYFMIFYPRNQKENQKDFYFSKDCNISPKIILNKEIKTYNNKYRYKKVFKFKNIGGKEQIELIFFIGEEDKYIIKLEIKGNIFIYDVDLKKGHKYLDNIAKEDMKQNLMEYPDKLDIFLDALKESKGEDKTKELYQETIELYSKRSSFSFLISLFAKIYKDKVMCSSLIKKFYEMNKSFKLNSKKDSNYNSNRNEKLGTQFNSLMVKIASEAEDLIKTNNYDRIQFYGIIICYLNYYEYNTFENCINKLYQDEKDRETLFEILLVYFSQFLNPVKKDESDKEFFIKFFEYIISKKEFSFVKIGLTFISDIDTFIILIDKTKEKLYDKYIKEKYNKTKFKSIELKDNLKLQEDKIDIITKGILSINNYSNKIKILLVFFKSDFWKSISKVFYKPNPNCFIVCSKLREIFREYYELIQSICDKINDKEKIEDIQNFYDIDEIAYSLNDIIKRFFNNKKKEGKKLKNSEILGYIKEYNPYYKEDNYKHKREAYILDELVFEYDIYSKDEDIITDHKIFIETFKALEYEDIFKDNMVKFIVIVLNKINNISSFDTVMDLIRVDKIKNKVKEYFEKLKNKYELVIKPNIETIEDSKIDKPVEIISKFVKLIFDNENNIDFLKYNISKLKISPLIYNQLIRICTDKKYNDMKNF